MAFQYMRETLMFMLIIIGLALFVIGAILILPTPMAEWSSYATLFVNGPIVAAGLYMIFYAIFDDSKKSLSIVIVLIVAAMFSVIYRVGTYVIYKGSMEKNLEWIYVVLPLLLISLFIAVVLNVLDRRPTGLSPSYAGYSGI